MRASIKVMLVMATAAVGLGVFAPSQATAGCVGPSITVVDATSSPVPSNEQAHVVPVSQDAELTVVGQYFFEGCNDTEGGGPGCSNHSPTQSPAKAVPLLLLQGGQTWVLGRADASGADDLWSTRWDVVLPSGVVPGAASLSAGGAEIALNVEAE